MADQNPRPNRLIPEREEIRQELALATHVSTFYATMAGAATLALCFSVYKAYPQLHRFPSWLFVSAPAVFVAGQVYVINNTKLREEIMEPIRYKAQFGSRS